MSKIKNVLNLSVLSLASLCLLGTGAYLSLQKQETTQVSSADVSSSISNNTPEYFEAIAKKSDNSVIKNLIGENSPLFLSNAGEYLNLRFATQSVPQNTPVTIEDDPAGEGSTTDTVGPFLYGADNADDESWSAFTFTSFSIKRNGKLVDLTLGTGNYSPKYITQQTTMEPSYANNLLTQQFDLQVKLGAENSVKNSTLTLDSEGVYEITIPYTIYTTIDNGNSFVSTSNETVTFTFMLFNHTTYLGSGVNIPNATPKNLEIEQLSSGIYDYYYYYNYTHGELPSITYDVTRYNLTITKEYNLESEEISLVYDNSLGSDAFVNSYSQNPMFDMTFNSNKATIYFKDLGDYTLDFDLVYTTEDFNTYALPHDVNDQKLYMFGYQSTYTQYDTEQKQNNYPEFKSFKENGILDKSADVTRFSKDAPSNPVNDSKVVLTGDVVPVSTNQAPVKFKKFSNNESGTLYKVTTANSDNGTTTLTLSGPETINYTKNISNPGTYLAVFEYTFDEFIADGLTNTTKNFYQLFYFEITNQTPSVDVYAGKDATNLTANELSSGDYTNQNVYIKNNFAVNEFDSDIIVEIEKVDYENNNTVSIKNLKDFDSNGDYYEIKGDGNYTIYIYYGRYGKSGTPIERRFNIDTNDITDIAAFGVQTSGSKSFYQATNQVHDLTNQPLIFSWEEEKLSGAKTFGYYKYYPLEKTNSFTGLTSNILNQFITYENAIPVDYKLNLESNTSWIYYENARAVENSNSISPTYVRSAGGLYILEVFDKAGNKAVKAFLLDNTSPNFAINEVSETGIDNFSILNGSVTLSKDATIYWSNNKFFKVEFPENTTSLYLNTENNEDSLLKDTINNFNNTYIKNVTSVDSAFKGDYAKIEINKNILFKDLTSENYEFKENISKFEIVSSYSLYYTEENGVYTYYFSTTTGDYIQVEDPSAENAIENGTKVTSSTLATTPIKYENNPDGKGYDSVYIREGDYSFLIRDKSNTKGLSLAEKDQYLNYPSAYQVANLTSDASLLSVVFDNNGKTETLTQASYAARDGMIEDKKFKDMFYQPTSIDKKLSISFIPRIVEGENVTQVESVKIEFYPFVNKSLARFNTENFATEITYFKTLSDTPEFSYNAYEFSGSESTDKITIDLNVVNNVTEEGKYVITRTYKTGGNYTINEYDFYKRTLTLIIDRENVISEPEVVEATTKNYAYTSGEETLEFSHVESTLVSSVSLKENYYIKATLESGLEVSTQSLANEHNINNKFFYTFDSKIKSIKLFTNTHTAINELAEVSTKTNISTQSVIGNGLLVSVFANSSDSVEYPNFKQNNDTYSSLNSGYSFYTTAQSYYSYNNTNDESKLELNPTPAFETNKVPLKLYIPEYKYSVTSDFVNTSDATSFFYEGKAINYYKLTAKIYRNTSLIAQSSAVTEDGFLSFKDLENNDIKYFTEPGLYSVIVTQANESVAPSETNLNSFKNRYVFSFIINETEPEYQIYDGEGKLLVGPNETTLYTNKHEVEIKWTDSDSEFNSNINKKKIEFNLNGVPLTISINSNGSIENNLNEAFSYSYSPLSKLNSIKINLSLLSIYSNKQYLTVTMYLESPADLESVYPELSGLYPSITKQVIVDTTSFSTTYDAHSNPVYSSTTTKLFEKIANLDYNLTHDSLRNYLDVNGTATTSMIQASYTSTVSSGFYRYYSYAVNKDFFDELYESVEDNIANHQSEVTSIYFRELSDIYTSSFEETSYTNFFPSNPAFTKLNADFTPKHGFYYEIIECDYAGNLNIYLVYFVKESDYAVSVNNPIPQTSGSVEKTAISDAELKSNKFNLYGNTNLAVTGINFQSDKWAFVKVDNGVSAVRLVLSPWLSQGKIKNLSSGEEIELSTILKDVQATQKTLLSVADRTNNTYHNVFVGKSNTSTLQINNLNDSEGIQIELPTANVMSDSTLRSFPIEVSIDIKATESNEDFIDYTFKNNPNANLENENYSYQTAWDSQTNSAISVSFDQTQNLLTVKFVEIPPVNTKLKYSVTDNFGKTTSLIHIVGTSFTDDIEYTGNLYESYDENGNLYKHTPSSLTYRYNTQIYKVKVFSQGAEIDTLDYLSNYITTSTENGISRLTFTCPASKQIDKKYEIKVYDAESEDETVLKSIYVHLYNMLPSINGEIKRLQFIDENANLINDKFGQIVRRVDINGNSYNYVSATTFATIINIKYDATPTEIPYQGFIYKENGDEIDFVPFESGYQIKEGGIYYILFKYISSDIFTNEYVLYRLEVLDSSTNFYYVTLDGQIIAPQDNCYTSPDNRQYSNYYMVNIPYSENTRVSIETNGYQKVRVSGIEGAPIYQGDITTVIYRLTNKDGATYPSGVSPYIDLVAITFVPQTQKPAASISYISQTGEEISLLDKVTTLVAASKESDFERLKIKWKRYNGISQNEIKISAEKGGYAVDLPIYYEGDFCYTLLSRSGTYNLKFSDSSGNVHYFGSRNYLELSFLKDVYFTMVQTEGEGEEEVEIETEVIDRGVFNNQIKLRLKDISKYYTTASVGNGSNMIHVKRNGEDYKDFTYEAKSFTFTFNEVGFYQVYFSAIANDGFETELREQVYSFTIINQNESRYAFGFSNFNGYKVHSAIMDNGTIIKEFAEYRGSDNLFITHQEDNSTTGLWTVVIDTNQQLTPGSDETTKFTFSFLIRSALPPIDVSIKEGATTTDTITVSFNAENIFNSVGDCIITIGNYSQLINKDTIAEVGVQTIQLTQAGTYYIQVATESGNILYTYKVIKKDPLNGWAIAAIVIGSVVVVAAVIIIIKLRKRIKIK